MKSLHVLFVTAELAPYTGESARAAGAHFLARALADLGLELTLALPGYTVSDPDRGGLARRLSPVSLDDAELDDVTIYEGNLSGGRAAVRVIAAGSQAASEEISAVQRRERFCRAALALAEQHDARPDVVIASHGAEPVLAMARERAGDGDAPATLFILDAASSDPALASALASSDRVVVSSHSLADQLRGDPDSDPLGALVAPVLPALRGVTPGIDFLAWNRRGSGVSAEQFRNSPEVGKPALKRALRRELGLRGPASAPLFAITTPIDSLVLTYSTSNELAQRRLPLAIIGNEHDDSRGLRDIAHLANQSSGRIVVRRFGDPDAYRAFERRVLSAADFAVFAGPPATSGPCELYCMHYGAIPIAPRVGRFAELLVEFDSGSATGSGFFYDPEDELGLLTAIDGAMRAYEKADSFGVLVDRALNFDLSWKTAARRYVSLLVEVLRDKRSLAA